MLRINHIGATRQQDIFNYDIDYSSKSIKKSVTITPKAAYFLLKFQQMTFLVALFSGTFQSFIGALERNKKTDEYCDESRKTSIKGNHSLSRFYTLR
jgi:hypothetical protein